MSAGARSTKRQAQRPAYAPRALYRASVRWAGAWARSARLLGRRRNRMHPSSATSDSLPVFFTNVFSSSSTLGIGPRASHVSRSIQSAHLVETATASRPPRYLSQQESLIPHLYLYPNCTRRSACALTLWPRAATSRVPTVHPRVHATSPWARVQRYFDQPIQRRSDHTNIRPA